MIALAITPIAIQGDVVQKSITTSFRLSPRLRRALEARAKAEGRGKNWIMSQALEQYLGASSDDIEAEARRQSLLAAAGNGDDWAGEADFGQWK